MKTLHLATALALSVACLSACHSPDQKWDSNPALTL